MPPAETQIEPEDMLDLLASLVDKSLVVYEEDEHGQGRYSMLQTVRQYGRSQLAAQGEETAIRRRHRDEFLRLAECAKPAMQGPEQTAWLDRLEQDHDNLRAALDWCLEEPDGPEGRESDGAQPGLQLASDLFFLWWIRGHLTEGQGYYSELLRRTGADARTAARVKALSRGGGLLSVCGDFAAARPLFEEGLAIARDLGDRKAEANLLCNLGDIALQSNPEEARTFLEKSLSIHREIRNPSGIAHASLLLGNTALHQDRPTEARALYAESLSLNRALGNPQKTGHALWCLARWGIHEGEYAEAHTLLEECVAILRQTRDIWGLSAALALAGEAALQEKEYERASPLIVENLQLVLHMGMRPGPWALRCFGRLAAAREDWVRLTCLFGAADAQENPAQEDTEMKDTEMKDTEMKDTEMKDTEAALSPFEAAALQEARTALGDTDFDAAWSAGKALSLEQAIQYALQPVPPAET